MKKVMLLLALLLLLTVGNALAAANQHFGETTNDSRYRRRKCHKRLLS